MDDDGIRMHGDEIAIVNVRPKPKLKMKLDGKSE